MAELLDDAALIVRASGLGGGAAEETLMGAELSFSTMRH
jgi:hypothetical protein